MLADYEAAVRAQLEILGEWIKHEHSTGFEWVRANFVDAGQTVSLGTLQVTNADPMVRALREDFTVFPTQASERGHDAADSGSVIVVRGIKYRVSDVKETHLGEIRLSLHATGQTLATWAAELAAQEAANA